MKIARIKTINRSVEFVFKERELRYEYSWVKYTVCEEKLIDINLCEDIFKTEKDFTQEALSQLRNQLVISK